MKEVAMEDCKGIKGSGHCGCKSDSRHKPEPDPYAVQGQKTGEYKHNCRQGCTSCAGDDGRLLFDNLPRPIRRHFMRKYVKAWMKRTGITKGMVRREAKVTSTSCSLKSLFDMAVEFDNLQKEESNVHAQ